MARKFLPTNRKLVDYEVAIALVYLLVMHILSFKLERQAPSWREFVFRVFLFSKKYRLFFYLAVFIINVFINNVFITIFLNTTVNFILRLSCPKRRRRRLLGD